MIEKTRANHRPEHIGSKNDSGADEVYSTYVIATIFLQIVTDNKARIRPSDQDRLLESKVPNHCGNIVGPFGAVSVVVLHCGPIRHSMAAKVQPKEPEA